MGSLDRQLWRKSNEKLIINVPTEFNTHLAKDVLPDFSSLGKDSYWEILTVVSLYNFNKSTLLSTLYFYDLNLLSQDMSTCFLV